MNTRPVPLSSAPLSPVSLSSSRFSAIALRQPGPGDQRQESSTSPFDSLAQLEAGLIRIVGGRATAALVQRSRQLCSQHGNAGLTLAHTLVQLATTLLGESLAGRLMHLGQLDVGDASSDPTSHH